MKLWSFSLTITRRDQILTEIDATLRKAGVTQAGTTGVQILADKLRAADDFARGAARRIFELEESIREYERAFQRIQLAERTAKAREQDEATPIEQAARRSSGVDLPQTQRTPVYDPGIAETRREKSVLHLRSDSVPGRIHGPVSDRIRPTQPETDKEA